MAWHAAGSAARRSAGRVGRPKERCLAYVIVSQELGQDGGLQGTQVHAGGTRQQALHHLRDASPPRQSPRIVAVSL